MPAAPVNSLPWGDLEVEVTAAGAVRVRDRSAPLLETGVGPVQIGDADHEWSETAISVDADEIEISYRLRSQSGLQLTVRHTFALAWTQRYIFENTGGEPAAVDHALLNFRAGPDRVAWFHGAGTAAALSVHPLRQGGPLLGARLQWGAVLARQNQLTGQSQLTRQAELDCGPFRLAAGARYIVQWRWDRYPDPASFARTAPEWLPAELVLPAGEPCRLSCPDAALVLPSGLTAAEADGSTELLPDRGAGCFPVEMRDVRGTATIELCWAPDLDQVILSTASAALAERRSGSGIPKLADAAAGLVVQRGLAESLLPDPEDAADALDLLSDRVRRADSPATFDVLYLCADYARTGEQDLVSEAVQIFTGLRLQPGIGLAAVRLCLALLVSGQDPKSVLAHLDGLSAAFHGANLDGEQDGDPGQDGPDPGSDGIAIELQLVARGDTTAPGAPGVADRQEPDDLLARVVRAGTQLGAGLPGARLPELPAVQRAYLVAVLQAAPDRVSADGERRWGLSAAASAARAQRRLLLELTDTAPLDDVTAVLGWLVLSD